MLYQERNSLSQKPRPFLVLAAIALLLSLPLGRASARVVDDVKVASQPDGYKITLYLLFDLRYQSHSPHEARGGNMTRTPNPRRGKEIACLLQRRRGLAWRLTGREPA